MFHVEHYNKNFPIPSLKKKERNKIVPLSKGGQAWNNLNFKSMDITILEDIGFTKAEIKVYFALLEMGKSGAGMIISKTGLQNSVVHMTLNRLLEKGVISYVKKGRFREYYPQDPNTILEIIEKKKESFEKLLPEILAKQKPVEKNEAEVFKGMKGLKTALYDLIDDAQKGDEFLFFSFFAQNPDDFDEVYDFYKEFAKDREEYGIITKGIAPASIKDKFAGRKLRNITFVNFPIPTNISVFRNKVLMTPWEEEKITFLIRSRQLAESFRTYFYSIWSKK